MNSAPTSTAPTSTNALYRAVWRWHFYAGIVVAPFAIFLAITGAIYLWKPQFEEWRYRDLFNVPGSTTTVSATVQFAAAQAAVPDGWRAQTFQPSFAPGRTTQVAFKSAGRAARPFGPVLNVFVNPHTGTVVGQLDDGTRFMRIVHDLHGTLLAGKTGEYLVELAASWALVLFLTGLYLWWPRPRFVVWGFLLPRLRAEGRVFWRDIHAVPAVWCAAASLFLLSTGMLWSQASGQWYRTISAAIGQGTPRDSSTSAHRSELVGWSPPLKAGLAQKIDALASRPAADDPHAEHRAAARDDSESSNSKSKTPAISLDRVVALAAEHQVPTPYAIALPVGPTGVYSVLSDRNQAFSRTYLHLDQYSGGVLADIRFKDFGYLAQFSLWGIIAHEGQLFGLLNQILGTLAALSVFLLAVSGLIMWWQRRPAGQLAAPVSTASLPRPVVIGTFALAMLLPLLAASLALLLIFDRLLSHRLPWFKLTST